MLRATTQCALVRSKQGLLQVCLLHHHHPWHSTPHITSHNVIYVGRLKLHEDYQPCTSNELLHAIAESQRKVHGHIVGMTSKHVWPGCQSPTSWPLHPQHGFQEKEENILAIDCQTQCMYASKSSSHGTRFSTRFKGRCACFACNTLHWAGFAAKHPSEEVHREVLASHTIIYTKQEGSFSRLMCGEQCSAYTRKQDL